MSDELTSQVRAILVSTPARWEALTRDVAADALRHSPAPGQWSAVECLQHLVDTEAGAFQPRIRGFLEGRDLPAFDPDAAGTRPDPLAEPAALAVKFAELRAEGLRLLDELTEADLDRTARHEELGPVTLREMLNEWAGHDLNHTLQGERALMQPFIVGSGAWREYFSDHDATK